MRVSRAIRGATLLAAVVLAAGQILAAQESFPQTLYWGSGLIDIPAAWVSPLTGDFGIAYGGKTFRQSPSLPTINFVSQYRSSLQISASFLGRVEAGVSFLSTNPEWGFFGQALVLDQNQFRDKVGLARWIPSFAVGLRNVGPYGQMDRFGVGYYLQPGTPQAQHVADTLHQNFSTNQTVYGVVTKSFAWSDLFKSGPNIGFSLSLGYGNGLFKDDGGLGNYYSSHSWGGVFGGLKMDFFPAKYTTVSVMAENNSWDYNLGALVDYRGLHAGLYWTEVGASSPTPPDTAPQVLYGYSKFSLSIGWQSNVLALVKGNFLQDRVTQLESRRQTLTTEIQKRQERIAQLKLDINRYEAQNLLELEERRSSAETELRAEKEALQKLEDRLKRLEQEGATPSTPPR